ncbi:MAG TPA: hypothetical protein VGQ81_08210 [Acidobacteriota bacterium]|jgi:hypothetical protein|nr:hypothetical protein [Acidobacteriota bacterium]
MRWLRATGNIKQITLCAAVVLASFNLLHSADTEKTFYYSSIAAGRSGGIVFRTVRG